MLPVNIPFEVLTPGAFSSIKWVSAEVAQSVEQWTENPRVGGSIPSLGTKRSWFIRTSSFFFGARIIT